MAVIHVGAVQDWRERLRFCKFAFNQTQIKQHVITFDYSIVSLAIECG